MSNYMKTWMRRSSLRGLSIQQRLPVLIFVLLLSLMVTFSWFSYISVKNATLKAGRDRLNTVSDQLISMLGQNALANIVGTRAVAGQESLKKCLLSLQPDGCEASLPILEKLRLDSSSILVEIRDADREVVLRSSQDSIHLRINFDSLLATFPRIDSGTIGKMYLVKDRLFYPIIAAITNNNMIIGYLIRWRLITSSPRTVQQLSGLMGAKSNFYFGNSDKRLWTDMLKPVKNPFPPEGRSGGQVVEYNQPDGSPVIGVEKSIKNTPWLMVMEFSQQAVMEPANRFLKWVIIIASILMAIGIFLGWLMSSNITRPLNKLTAAVSLIASGREAGKVAVERKDEVGKLARAFNAMNEQVRLAKHDLEQKVVETEQANEQLRSLSAHLQNIREEERMHIAREMHDELGQLLTGFKMDVSWLNKKIGASTEPGVQEKLKEMMSIVDDAASFVRRLAAELRPSILDDLGLIPALEWHSKEFTKRFDIEVDFQTQMNEFQTSGVVATGLFRMYQESLTNVARHSGATKVNSMLEFSKGQIKLTIQDNGKGFDMAATGERKTLGLLGMKERAVMIGGKLEINSVPGGGTTVTVSVPG